MSVLSLLGLFVKIGPRQQLPQLARKGGCRYSRAISPSAGNSVVDDFLMAFWGTSLIVLLRLIKVSAFWIRQTSQCNGSPQVSRERRIYRGKLFQQRARNISLYVFRCWKSVLQERKDYL